MTYVDKTITCVDCQDTFTHSAEDQQRYAERGFTNEPKRCAACRSKRKTTGGGHGGGGGGRMGGYSGGAGGGGRGGSRELHPATCAGCGKPTEVPFKPTEGRPVYCRDCYQGRSR